jgi:hypothetical protein
MAICPKCRAAMGATEVACPSCGYDFPAELAPKREGFAYSAFADVGLIVSMMAAGLGCVVSVYFVVMFLLMGMFSQSSLAAIIVFLQLGVLIVFMRVSDLKK